jgi:hypothetical protein
MFRTDDNLNPTAFTVDIARQAGLIEGTDYVPGTPFPAPSPLVTAKLLHDPVLLTVQVINKIGFYTHAGPQRWSYIAMPVFVWRTLPYNKKRDVIGFMYQREGGTAMRRLFPSYGAL